MSSIPRLQRWAAFALFLVSALPGCRASGHVGMASSPQASRHAKVAAGLEARLVEFRERSDLTGVSAAISMPDGAVVARAVGLADRESGQALRPDHRMLAGSVGKTYVAAVILQLVSEGKLGLDDPVAGFFAASQWYPRVPNHEMLTPRMLLNHTSGLPRWVFEPALWQAMKADPTKRWTGAERLALILDRPAEHPAGQGWAYSDTNYILLGMIIESLAGKPYYDVLEERLLAPLSLRQTQPSNRRELANLAAGYTGASNPFELPVKTAANGVYVINPQFEWTGGGVMTTPSDLTRWARALYAGDVLAGKVRAEMVRPVAMPTRLPGDAGYGLGTFVRQTDLGPEYGHEGIMPGYLSAVSYFVRDDLAIAVQVNEDSFTGKHQVPLHQFVHDTARWLATLPKA